MAVVYGDVIERVNDVAAELPDPERRDARRVVELARQLGARPTAAPSVSEDEAIGRELQRLVEGLGRRGARALPAAALGRALLADRRGAPADRDAALGECDAKLALFGL